MAKAEIGKFVWHEVHSTEPQRTVRFYTELFGWKTKPMDMGPMGTYTIFEQDGTQVGGCMQAHGGSPSFWLAYASVENVDAATDRATAAGGTVMEKPMDIPNIGRWSLVKDAQGAILAPFTPAGTPPVPTGTEPTVGVFAWDEIMTSDPEAAAKFYGAVYGWKAEKPKSDDAFGYWHFNREVDGKPKGCAGMMKAQEGQPIAWLSYLSVANVDTMYAKAQGLGAKPIVGPMDIPGGGRFAIMLDPTGAAVGLYKGAH